MSFFAVLDVQDDESRGRFEVDELHVNVWSLAGLWPRRRVLMVDVGVKIRSGSMPTKGLSIAIPFRALEGVDLSEELMNSITASLIFDAETSYDTQNSLLKIDGSAMHLLASDASTSEKETSLSSETITVWKVGFVKPLAAGKTGYYRMRFPVDASRSWEWQRRRLVRGRDDLIIDLRVSDVRSTLEIKGGPAIRSRVLPIKRAYLFAVLPQWLAPTTLSPDPSYIRLLEPRVWGNYLDRRAEIGRRRLVVYQWKNDRDAEGDPIEVTQDRAMRLYGRFEPRIRFAMLRLAGVAVVLALIVTAVFFEVPAREWVQAAVVAIGAWIAEFWLRVLVPLGLFGVFTWIVNGWKRFQWLRDRLRKAEAWVFKTFLRPEK